MNYAAELFSQLERLIGRPEARRRKIESTRPGLPPVYALFFPDVPGPGLLTAVTLGVGLGSHVEELGAHVELVTTLRTQDHSWGEAAAWLAEHARDQVVLAPGSTLNLGEAISQESAMSGFLLTRPHLWPVDAATFRCSDRTVTLLDAHPVYPDELLAIRHCDRDRIAALFGQPTYDPRRSILTLGAA